MNSHDDFMLRGYDLYSDAALEVWTFQSNLFARLNKLLDGVKDWGRFKHTKRRSEAGGTLEDGWWVCVTQHGTVDEKAAALELGYWWKPPNDSRKPIVYSILHWLPMTCSDTRDGIETFHWNGRTVLASPMPRDLDARPLLAQQLEILMKASGAK